MNKKIKHSIIAIFSLVALASSLFIYVKIENQAELQNAKLGYPIHFLEQDFSAKYGNKPFFPTWERVDLRGQGSVAKISFFNILIDFVLIFIIEGVVYILETIDFAFRKEK